MTKAGGAISARFLFEGDVEELQNECCSMAETHCVADFCAGVEVAFRASPHAGRELEDDEEWVYLRWEPSR